MSFVLSPAWAGWQFDDGFENGLSAWNTRKAKGSIITSDKREGKKCYEFVDNPGVERSELTALSGGTFDWGTEYWQGFSIKIIEAPASNTFRIISQHHSVPHLDTNGDPDWSTPAGGNSFAMKNEGSNFRIYTATVDSNVYVKHSKGGATWGTESFTVPYSLNTWYDFVLHFKYAKDSTGYFQIWMNGTLIFNDSGPNVYIMDSGGFQKAPWQYFKIGQYYGYNSDQNGGILRYDALKVWKGPGGSYEMVVPGGSKIEPPQLSLSHESNAMKMVWPQSPGWSFQMSEDLLNWSVVENTEIIDDMGTYVLTEPQISQETLSYYRLAPAN